MLTPDSPVAETSGSSNQICPQRRLRGIHSSQNKVLEYTHLLRRRSGLQGPNLDIPVKSVHIQRPPGEICIDINGQCICKINIHAILVRGSAVQSMTLSNMFVQSITGICLYVNCVLRVSTTERH